MKSYLVGLLCLANYSFRDINYQLQIKLKKVVLSSDQKYFDSLMEKSGKIARNQPFFHNLSPLKLDYDFTMKQFPNIKNNIKNCILNNKMFLLSPKRLYQIKKANSIKHFQLTIFYYFEKNTIEESDIFQSKKLENSNVNFKETKFKIVDECNIYNLLIVQNTKPIIFMYNSFIHNIHE